MKGRASTRRILLVGAGHAQVEVLRSFATSPMPDVSLTLATPSRFTPYSGMLPGVVAGLYRVEEAHIDVRQLAAVAGATFVEQAVVALDLESRRARCADGTSIAYDILSIDVGATPASQGVPGAADHAIPVKPIAGFLAQFETVVAGVRAGRVQRIALVGAGAGGVELALAVERRLRREAEAAGRNPAALAVSLVSATPTILPGFPASLVRRLCRILQARDIAVLTDARVTAVEAKSLSFDARPPLEAEAVLWVTQAVAPAWLGETGLPLDAAGFVAVEAGLDVRGWPGIFAAGDMASFGPRDLPKAGGLRGAPGSGAGRQSPSRPRRPRAPTLPAAAPRPRAPVDGRAPRGGHPQWRDGRGRLGLVGQGPARPALGPALRPLLAYRGPKACHPHHHRVAVVTRQSAAKPQASAAKPPGQRHIATNTTIVSKPSVMPPR